MAAKSSVPYNKRSVLSSEAGLATFMRLKLRQVKASFRSTENFGQAQEYSLSMSCKELMLLFLLQR
jgi:hypothetical protein